MTKDLRPLLNQAIEAVLDVRQLLEGNASPRDAVTDKAIETLDLAFRYLEDIDDPPTLADMLEAGEPEDIGAIFAYYLDNARAADQDRVIAELRHRLSPGILKALAR